MCVYRIKTLHGIGFGDITPLDKASISFPFYFCDKHQAKRQLSEKRLIFAYCSPVHHSGKPGQRTQDSGGRNWNKGFEGMLVLACSSWLAKTAFLKWNFGPSAQGRLRVTKTKWHTFVPCKVGHQLREKSKNTYQPIWPEQWVLFSSSPKYISLSLNSSLSERYHFSTCLVYFPTPNAASSWGLSW